jgi:hypothetical protein
MRGRMRMAMAGFLAGAALAAARAADPAPGTGMSSRPAEAADSAADSTNGWGYGYDSLLRDLAAWRQDSNVRVDSFGASVQGRALWMVSITAPGDSTGRGGELPARKRRVFIHARTHPAEVQAFWVAREIIRFLLSGDAQAAELRRDFIFNLVPMYNPDGVELGKARQNANGIDLESDWDARPMQPEPTALKRAFMAFMSGPIPIEVALNLHSDQYNCARFFFFHYAEGTSPAYAEMEKAFIGGVQAHFPGGIKDWGFVKSWANGTVTHYPEGFWWVNHREQVMALTYEDNNSLTAQGATCPNAASGFDSTGRALALGSADYIRSRPAAPVLARRAPVTRVLLAAEGLRFPPGEAYAWAALDPRGRRRGVDRPRRRPGGLAGPAFRPGPHPVRAAGIRGRGAADPALPLTIRAAALAVFGMGADLERRRGRSELDATSR